LKSIFTFMKDFKNILDEYRKEKLNRKWMILVDNIF
jgi:hypothetical protein